MAWVVVASKRVQPWAVLVVGAFWKMEWVRRHAGAGLPLARGVPGG
jgi:hypothetical protein